MKIIQRFWVGWGVFCLLFGVAGCATTTPPIGGEFGKEEVRGGKAEPPKEAGAIPAEKEMPSSPAVTAPPPSGPLPPSPVPQATQPAVTAPPAKASAPAVLPVPPPPAAPAVIGPSPNVPQPSPVQLQLPRTGRFVLNFDNADLYEVIRVMADMMKINYVIDPRVRGVVNIHTSGQIGNGDIFPIFQSVLKLNGATAVPKGMVYEIVPFADAKKLFSSPLVGKGGGRGPAEEKYTIQVVTLKWVPAGEMSKTIKPFLSDGADIVEYVTLNTLIIGDVASNVKKALDIIELFDTDIFAEMRVRIYPVLNADVIEIAKEMERLFGSLEVSVKSGRGVGITFTPITRINSLLVVSGIPQVFDKVERWLKELDKMPGLGSKLSVFVYYVQNGKAKDLAEVLRQVYARQIRMTYPSTPGMTGAGTTGYGTTGVGTTGYGTTGYGAASSGTAVPSSQQRLIRPLPPGVTEAALPPGSQPEGEISIVIDETTNSLIVRALQRDYNTILETVKKLDLYPKQVLIEVMLAEVTLDKNTQFGLEFSTFQDSFSKGSTTYNQTFGMGGTAAAAGFTSGMRYAISATDKLMAAIRASATDSRLKVISSPHILASNNKEAKIQVGTSQPILTNTYTTTATGTPGVVEGTIEYKDTGIILTVTPRVSDGGLVSLDVNVENSSVQFAKLGNLNSVPFFNKKTAKTTLAIMGGQTIVIGGLIAETRDDSSSGVPFLSRIPILGGLFGYQIYARNKTETLLLLTPHVIADLEQSNAVTREIQEKVQAIKKEVEIKERRMRY